MFKLCTQVMKFGTVFLSIVFASILSANEYGVDAVLLKNSMRIEGETREFSWLLTFELDADGKVIEPDSCSEFIKMVTEIYDADFANLVKESKRSALGGIEKIENIEELEALLEALSVAVENKTGKTTDTFFYSVSANYILRRLNFEKISCDCQNLPSYTSLHSDFNPDFIILNSLIGSEK